MASQYTLSMAGMLLGFAAMLEEPTAKRQRTISVEETERIARERKKMREDEKIKTHPESDRFSLTLFKRRWRISYVLFQFICSVCRFVDKPLTVELENYQRNG